MMINGAVHFELTALHVACGTVGSVEENCFINSVLNRLQIPS